MLAGEALNVTEIIKSPDGYTKQVAEASATEWLEGRVLSSHDQGV